MTIMTIRIPDELKEALDKAFEGRDKHAIIGQIIRDGLAARGIVPEMLPARDEELAETPAQGRGRDLGAPQDHARSIAGGVPAA